MRLGAFLLCGVANFRLQMATGAVAILLALGGSCVPVVASPAATDSTTPKATSAGASEGQETPAPTPDATAEAEKKAEDCKNNIADLTSGNLSALEARKDKLDALLGKPVAVSALMCLAIAEGNSDYCKLLSQEKKEECLAQFRLVGELKGLPKERMKGQLMYRACHGNLPDKDCESIRDAMAAGDAAKCAGISDAGWGVFCAALATGDVAKCKDVPPEGRGDCEGYVSEDENRCPKESGDCRRMVRVIAAIKKNGLAGLEGIDPRVAAAVKGKQACDPLLSELQGSCTEEDKPAK
jgi:hypothetical protein